MTRKGKSSAAGFSAVHGLIIVLVVALVGFAGWLVWHSQKKPYPSVKTDNTAAVTAKKPVAPVSKTKVDPSASWYQFHSSTGKYSVRIPDGWKDLGVNCPGETELVGTYSNNFAIVQGQKAQVAIGDECYGKDAVPTLYLDWHDESKRQEGQRSFLDGYNNDKNLVSHTSFINNAGVLVDVYHDHVTIQPDTLDDPTLGEHYGYVIKRYNTSKTFLYVGYHVDPGKIDYHENIEQMVKTVILN